MPVSHTRSEWSTRVRLRVREALAEHKMSAAYVARQAGWRQQYLARRLTPTRPVPFSVDDLAKIAAVLGVAPKALMPEPGAQQ